MNLQELKTTGKDYRTKAHSIRRQNMYRLIAARFEAHFLTDTASLRIRIATKNRIFRATTDMLFGHAIWLRP